MHSLISPKFSQSSVFFLHAATCYQKLGTFEVSVYTLLYVQTVTRKSDFCQHTAACNEISGNIQVSS